MAQQISAFPPVPLLTDTPEVFDPKAVKWNLFQANTLRPELNALATEAETNAGTAETKAAEALASAELSEDWATTVDALVEATDYSSKEWAQGTTAESAKRWATDTGATVDGSEYAAKEYASGSTVPTGSAKEWANGATQESAKRWATELTEISGGFKGARGYAQDAEAQAEIVTSAANFKGQWSTLTGALNVPASVFHNDQYWQLLNDLADVTLSEPGVSADWASATVLQGNATGAIDMAGFALTIDELIVRQPIDMAGNELTVDAVNYDAIDKGTVSTGTVSFDVQAATKQKLTVGGALTIELTNKPANDWELEIDLTNGGSAAITFPTVNWLVGDGTTSTVFADMGVTLNAAGVNTLLFWATGSGDVYGRAG